MKEALIKRVKQGPTILTIFLACVILFSIIVSGINCLWDLGTFFITLLGGFFVAGMVLLTQEVSSFIKFKRNFNWLKGNWDGGGKLENRGIVKDNPSDAEVRYLSKNVLSISLTHDQATPRTWEGIIEMNQQITNRGSLVFKYNDSHESGYKEILVSSDKNHDYIFLYPVILDGQNPMKYGIQVLKRKKRIKNN
jgi:hypothetical protein